MSSFWKKFPLPGKNFIRYLALQRNFDLFIIRKGIARPQHQFPRSCVCERSIYSHVRSNFSCSRIRRPIRGIYLSLTTSQKHEFRNWDCSRAVPFLVIFVLNFRYCAFAVWPYMSWPYLAIVNSAYFLSFFRLPIFNRPPPYRMSLLPDRSISLDSTFKRRGWCNGLFIMGVRSQDSAARSEPHPTLAVYSATIFSYCIL